MNEDAIDLGHYRIEVACAFVRVASGPTTVAQPIDRAAITRHEEFPWVRRKQYNFPEFNPPARRPNGNRN